MQWMHSSVLVVVCPMTSLTEVLPLGVQRSLRTLVGGLKIIHDSCLHGMVFHKVLMQTLLQQELESTSLTTPTYQQPTNTCDRLFRFGCGHLGTCQCNLETCGSTRRLTQSTTTSSATLVLTKKAMLSRSG